MGIKKLNCSVWYVSVVEPIHDSSVDTGQVVKRSEVCWDPSVMFLCCIFWLR